MTDEAHRLNARIPISVWPKFYPGTANFDELKKGGFLYPHTLDARHQGLARLRLHVLRRLQPRGPQGLLAADQGRDLLQGLRRLVARRQRAEPRRRSLSRRAGEAHRPDRPRARRAGHERLPPRAQRRRLQSRSARPPPTGAWPSSPARPGPARSARARSPGRATPRADGRCSGPRSRPAFPTRSRAFPTGATTSAASASTTPAGTRTRTTGSSSPAGSSSGPSPRSSGPTARLPYREPWFYGGDDHPAFRTLQKFTELRYRLLPYIYAVAARVTFDHDTMMRALVMDFPDDPHGSRREGPVPLRPGASGEPGDGLARDLAIRLPAGGALVRLLDRRDARRRARDRCPRTLRIDAAPRARGLDRPLRAAAPARLRRPGRPGHPVRVRGPRRGLRALRGRRPHERLRDRRLRPHPHHLARGRQDPEPRRRGPVASCRRPRAARSRWSS